VSRARRLVFWTLVAAQALLPLGLIGWNELALATGTEVTLRTAPVDPLDPFRGRYVQLRYEITASPREFPEGTEVYVPLRDAGEVWVADGPPTTEQPDGTAIRGRYVGGAIRFGIERFFVDEDEAPELERAGPLLVDVVLDGDGRARISGARPVR
jgi:uncharacterized membrane-anchored protein